MLPKIINTKENPPEETNYKTIVGDTTFKWVMVTLEDGRKAGMAVSEAYPGKFFKQVLVPWEFEHEAIVP